MQKALYQRRYLVEDHKSLELSSTGSPYHLRCVVQDTRSQEAPCEGRLYLELNCRGHISKELSRRESHMNRVVQKRITYEWNCLEENHMSVELSRRESHISGVVQKRFTYQWSCLAEIYISVEQSRREPHMNRAVQKRITYQWSCLEENHI